MYLFLFFFFEWYGAHRDLHVLTHSFPTLRSSDLLAPKTTVHGVFMDVLGLGVLITGEAGLGKSELALELISRGHGLVADDAVELSRTAPNFVEGQDRKSTRLNSSH